jgi:hypothetical protein
VPDQFKARVAEQVFDVPLSAGEEVIEAKDFVTFVEEAFGEVGAEEAGSTGDENAHGKIGKLGNWEIGKLRNWEMEKLV